MKAKKSKAGDGCDHTFRAIYDHEVEWESDDVLGLLKLPPGLKVKVLNYDSWHSILVTKGRMCVAGKDLRPGDYVFGWDILHGPYEYPDGCEVFIVYMGDATHVWEQAQLLKHKNTWKPKTTAGKKGVLAHLKKRKAGKV